MPMVVYMLCNISFLGKPGEPLPVTSEHDIFDYLGVDYKKPSERTN